MSGNVPETCFHQKNVLEYFFKFVYEPSSLYVQIQHRHAQEVKVDDLQKTLVHMKFVNGKREIVHQQIRSKLQDEIRSLKEQKVGVVYNRGER